MGALGIMGDTSQSNFSPEASGNFGFGATDSNFDLFMSRTKCTNSMSESAVGFLPLLCWSYWKFIKNWVRRRFEPDLMGPSSKNPLIFWVSWRVRSLTKRTKYPAELGSQGTLGLMRCKFQGNIQKLPYRISHGCQIVASLLLRWKLFNCLTLYSRPAFMKTRRKIFKVDADLVHSFFVFSHVRGVFWCKLHEGDNFCLSVCLFVCLFVCFILLSTGNREKSTFIELAG